MVRKLEFSFFVAGNMKDYITPSLLSNEMKFFQKEKKKELEEGSVNVEAFFGKTDEVRITMTDEATIADFLKEIKSTRFMLSLRALKAVKVNTRCIIDGRKM